LFFSIKWKRFDDLEGLLEEFDIVEHNPIKSKRTFILSLNPDCRCTKRPLILIHELFHYLTFHLPRTPRGIRIEDFLDNIIDYTTW